MTQARLAFSRQQELFKDGWTARAKFDEAQQKLLNAEGQVDSAQAQMRIAEEQQSYTTLFADAPGAVTAVGAEPGEVVHAGQMVVQVAREGGRDAVFDVPEQLIRVGPARRPGRDRAQRRPEREGDRPGARGRAAGGCRDADVPGQGRHRRSARGHAARLHRRRPPPALRRPQGVEIPASALTEANGRPAVWVVDAQSKTVSLRSVEVLRYDPASVVISQGLAAGDVVVTAGAQTLRPGQKVQLLGARDDRLQSFRLGDPASVARDLFHARHRGRGRLVLLAARPERGSGLHRQDHGGAGRLARRDGQRHAPADHRPPRAQAPGDAESRLPEELHDPGEGHGLRQPKGFDAARLRCRTSGIRCARRSTTSATTCRKASSAPASTTSSATPTASSTASPRMGSAIGS